MLQGRSPGKKMAFSSASSCSLDEALPSDPMNLTPSEDLRDEGEAPVPAPAQGVDGAPVDAHYHQGVDSADHEA